MNAENELRPIYTLVPGEEPIRLVAYVPSMRDYYPKCELQSKRWCTRNIAKDWNIFDVGANIGYYAALFGRCAPDGKVIAYEPSDNAELARKNLAANGIGNVEIREVAVGETAGNRSDAIFSLWGDDPEVREWPFSTVDQQVRELGWDRLDLLKIDVDSFDLEVLKGAVETLDRLNPWIMVELNHALAKGQQGVGEALDWLASRGYDKARVLDRENYILRRSALDDRSPKPSISLQADREPVYLVGALRASDLDAGTIGECRVENGSLSPDGTDMIQVTGGSWNYAASWPITATTDGPAILEMTVEVEGGDITIMPADHAKSDRVADEPQVTAGSATTLRIEVERAQDLGHVILRKGPKVPDQSRVRVSAMSFKQAMAEVDRDPPPSHDPALSQIELARIATGLDPVPDVPDDMLDLVDAHDLAGRLHVQGAFRSPLDIVDIPLSQFRMEQHDYHILEQIYRTVRPSRHLEFGTWEGFGAALCARSCDARIWTLNLPEGELDDAGRPLYGTGSGASDAGAGIGRIYREQGFEERITQLLMDSRDLDEASFGPGFFDSVLIDGGHTRELVESDTEKALRLTRAGGLVMWHDFCPDPATIRRQEACQGVASAVLGNWERWRPALSDLFWVRPSFLLIGIRAQTGFD